MKVTHKDLYPRLEKRNWSGARSWKILTQGGQHVANASDCERIDAEEIAKGLELVRGEKLRVAPYPY